MRLPVSVTPSNTPTNTPTVTPTTTPCFPVVISPTPTMTSTVTPTITPSSTSFPICPEQLELSYFSGGTQITPPFVNYINAVGTYSRVYSNLSTSFVAGFAKNIPAVFFPGAIDYGTYIGRNYSVWERNVGSEYFTLINYFVYPAGYVLLKTTGTTFVNGGTPITQVIGVSTTAITDGSVYYPVQGNQNIVLSGNTNWYVSYPTVCPTTTPTPTTTVTPTPTNTPGLPPTPTPSITPTNTITPTITPSVTSTPTKDVYLANVYDCFDCSFLGQEIVAFPIGTPVTIGFFYNDEFVSGLVYEIVSTFAGSPTTNCILPGQPTCAQACSL